MQLEWTYHLTSQLDQQKQYFEERLLQMESSLSEKLAVSNEENKRLQVSTYSPQNKLLAQRGNWCKKGPNDFPHQK